MTAVANYKEVIMSAVANVNHEGLFNTAAYERNHFEELCNQLVVFG